MYFKEWYPGRRVLLLVIGVGWWACIAIPSLFHLTSPAWLAATGCCGLAGVIAGTELADKLGRHAFRYFVAGVFLSGATFLIAFLPPIRSWTGPAPSAAPRVPTVRYGDVRCSKCGTIYGATLTLFDPKEVKVAHCRVCPANRVYAVCGRCADLEGLEGGACPFCGARHQWEVKGMVPAG